MGHLLGAYALPGQVMRVTRRDEGDVTVKVFVNPQRDGSTHEWEDSVYGGYSRPKFLQTQSVPLPPGKTVSFTSVYGGPVQLGFDKTGVEVEVDFENVGEHPHWASTADDERFAQALQAATYDWVEVETEAFEIHSRLELFQRTMEFDPTWDTPAKLTAIIEKYTFNYSHVAAGFAGNGVDAVPEIVDWASSKGFDMPVVDLVKHANLDKPSEVMMMAKSKGKLTDGYHMIPRIHVLDRAFRAALATDAS